MRQSGPSILVLQFLLAGLVVLFAIDEARAQTAFVGFIVEDLEDGECWPTQDDDIELYALKLPADGSSSTDWHYSIDRMSVGGADLLGAVYSFLGGNFTVREHRDDRVFVFLTAGPEEEGQGHRVAMDSGTPFTPNLNGITLQVIGETIPSHVPDHAGTGFRLPGDGQPVQVNWGDGPLSYPRWVGDDVQVVFGALIDLQPTMYDPLVCSFGGQEELFGAPGQGALIGYNVYSRVGSETEPPEHWSSADWVAFVPHELNGMTPSPDDDTGTTILDLDATPYNGNEYLHFRHEGGAETRSPLPVRGGPRRGPIRFPHPPRAPGRTEVPGRWYVIQPVVHGDYNDWSPDTAIARVPLGFDPRMSDGGIDLTADGIAEFISPQAVEAGLPGLGLSHDGEILTSAPVYFSGGEVDAPPRGWFPPFVWRW
ncbi:MAG: hypothetical protein AAF533_16210 [Acidobacteriota bacterium]